VTALNPDLSAHILVQNLPKKNSRFGAKYRKQRSKNFLAS
jgi:hypothetical protein